MARPRSIWYDAVRIRGISHETPLHPRLASTPCLPAMSHACEGCGAGFVRCKDFLNHDRGVVFHVTPTPPAVSVEQRPVSENPSRKRPASTTPARKRPVSKNPTRKRPAEKEPEEYKKKRSRSEAACLRGDVYPAAVRKVCCCDIDHDLLVVAQIGAADVVWKGLCPDSHNTHCTTHYVHMMLDNRL